MYILVFPIGFPYWYSLLVIPIGISCWYSLSVFPIGFLPLCQPRSLSLSPSLMLSDCLYIYMCTYIYMRPCSRGWFSRPCLPLVLWVLFGLLAPPLSAWPSLGLRFARGGSAAALPPRSCCRLREIKFESI